MGPFKGGWAVQDAQDAIKKNDPDELLYVPVIVSSVTAASRFSNQRFA